MSAERSAATGVQPQVGEWWTTPDGINWRVDAVTERTVKLSTSRSYGVMKASAHRAEFVRRARRRSQRSESYA